MTPRRRVIAALRVHTTIEEEIFYRAFVEATEEKELHHEAEIEHEGAKTLIAKIEASGPEDDYFDGPSFLRALPARRGALSFVKALRWSRIGEHQQLVRSPPRKQKRIGAPVVSNGPNGPSFGPRELGPSLNPWNPAALGFDSVPAGGTCSPFP